MALSFCLDFEHFVKNYDAKEYGSIEYVHTFAMMPFHIHTASIFFQNSPVSRKIYTLIKCTSNKITRIT